MYQETGYGDRDGDGDVDATDKGTPGSTCTGTVSGACRILDLDFDGDYDSTDAGLFNPLPQGLARHPGRIATAVDQPFGHQGLLHEPEIRSYQNRTRQYDPGKRRFVQRDPYDVTHGDRSAYQDGMDSYVYVRGRPLSSRDPSGRECEGGFLLGYLHHQNCQPEEWMTLINCVLIRRNLTRFVPGCNEDDSPIPCYTYTYGCEEAIVRGLDCEIHRVCGDCPRPFTLFTWTEVCDWEFVDREEPEPTGQFIIQSTEECELCPV
ncbi:MAG: hypothetical protein JSU86_12980 [Phycisphaerales bacterium]|nr:MAG: hypothetical protein JSU86_12980 [Phycisphaerales bacterium]